MNAVLASLWTPLAPSPLVWMLVTLAAWLLGLRLHEALARASAWGALANPVLIAIALVAGAVWLAGVPYATYFAGAQFIHFLLGPATVALAVPLARNIVHVGRSLKAVVLALLAGALASIGSGVMIVRALGGSGAVALSMAPKAATTPIAIAIARQMGGVPALTATLAIVGGILAASVGRRLLLWLRIEDSRAHGFAAGVAGSGIAAAEAAKLGSLATAFGALGIALNGVITALLAPLFAALLH